MNADSIITTEKDSVKLMEIANDMELEIPVFALRLGLDIDLESLIGDLSNIS